LYGDKPNSDASYTEPPYLPHMPYWQYETSHSMAQHGITAPLAPPPPPKSPVEEFTCILEGPEKQADMEKNALVGVYVRDKCRIHVVTLASGWWVVLFRIS